MKRYQLSIILTVIALAFLVSCKPVVNSVVPQYGPAGTEVVITGSNFTGVLVDGVRIDGLPVDAFSVESATSIRATVPTGAGTCLSVSVINKDGTGTLASAYAYEEPAEPTGSERGYAMGMVPILVNAGEDPRLNAWYQYDMLKIAEAYTEMVMLPDHVWDACEEGVPHPKDLSGSAGSVPLLHHLGLEVVVGLDPTVPDRKKVGPCMTPDYDEFADQGIRDSFADQVRAVFEYHGGPGDDEINYPEYLVVAYEINMYYCANQADWWDFASLVSELKAIVRSYTDKTQVIVEFHRELIDQPWPIGCAGQLARLGDIDADILGVSMFPSAYDLSGIRTNCGYDPAVDLPINYLDPFFDSVINYRDLPVAITQTGWPGASGGTGLMAFFGDDLHHNNYLIRLAEMLDRQPAERTPFLIWWTMHDLPAGTLDDYFKKQRLIVRDRECYPDDFPPPLLDPVTICDSGDPCSLCPQGPAGWETWQELKDLALTK